MRGLKPPTVPNINLGNVASFTDAWIETGLFGSIGASRRQSHLLQMRGLKLQGAAYAKTLAEVASFTDAWIETRT